jgi:hypothetical protein
MTASGMVWLKCLRGSGLGGFSCHVDCAFFGFVSQNTTASFSPRACPSIVAGQAGPQTLLSAMARKTTVTPGDR